MLPYWHGFALCRRAGHFGGLSWLINGGLQVVPNTGRYRYKIVSHNRLATCRALLAQASQTQRAHFAYLADRLVAGLTAQRFGLVLHGPS